MRPEVSIVMPVHMDRFLPTTLDSLLAQTLRNFELIVIDNGTTDRTPEILRAYAARDNRIRVIRNAENLGASAARNAGGAEARADLIAVMDHDDVAMPDRLEKQAAFLRSNPDIAAVGGAIQVMDANGVLGQKKSFPLPPGLVAWSMLFFSSVSHPTVMMRAKAFRESGGYDLGTIAADDFQLLMPMSWRSRVGNLPDIVVRYRWWGGNITTVRGELQDAEADRIVQTNIREIGGFDVTRKEAHALRGLARNDYATAAVDLTRLADIVEALVPAYLRRVARTAEDRQAILRDAGVRLWLLGAVALRAAPLTAARLVARASRICPGSGLSFLAKAGQRLVFAGRA